MATSFKAVLKKDVTATDVLVGGLIGLAGQVGARFLWTQYLKDNASLPDFLKDSEPSQHGKALITLAGALAAGSVAFLAQKRNKRGQGHLIGASAVGVAGTAFHYLHRHLKDANGKSVFDGVDEVYVPGYGLLTDDRPFLRGASSYELPAMNGMIVDDADANAAMAAYADRADMADLARLSMVVDDEFDAAVM
jgi:hypothetical protein